MAKMASDPYADYLAGQITEVMERFAPVDGLFLDICMDFPSASQWGIARMQAWGLRPESEEDRASRDSDNRRSSGARAARHAVERLP